MAPASFSLASATISSWRLLPVLVLSGSAIAEFPQFVDISASAGLANFHNKQGTVRKDYILESIGGGCALFDFDNDGWLDILLVRGADLSTYSKGGEPVAALYRNNRNRSFRDVSVESGIASARGWGMGVVTGDYNSDGLTDVFVTGYGRSFLFKNLGNGRFAEVGQAAGIASSGLWSTGAAFLDYDRDGLLDLYVARYVKFDHRKPVERSPLCKFKGLGVFCGPQGFASDPHSLYRNHGDGTFEDVSAKTGLRAAQPPFHGLGVMTLDYNNDGFTDIYVANDSTPNLLWRNSRKGTFVNAAVDDGAAFGADGREQASMGVASGDLGNRGLLDLFVTEFSGEAYSLYRATSQHGFEHATWSARMGAITLPYLGWSTHMMDFDNDGWLDILAVNGHVYPEADSPDSGTSYRQKLLAFRNLRDGKFVNIAPQLGPAFAMSYAGRGAAIGDIDNDGLQDVLINNIDGSPALLHNRGHSAGNWLVIDLNPASPGARIELRTKEFKQLRELSTAIGYLSSSSTLQHFGLGSATTAAEVLVTWPSGRKRAIQNTAANQILRIIDPERSTGAAIPDAGSAPGPPHPDVPAPAMPGP